MKKIVVALMLLSGCGHVITKPRPVVHAADSTSTLVPVIDPLKPQGGK